MSKKSRIALGTIFAAGLGYAVGVLTAPKSGSETRKDIQEKTQKAKTEAERSLKRLHSELTTMIETGKTKAKQAKTTTKKELVEALATAQLAKEKARVLLSAIHEGDADDRDLRKAITESKKAMTHLKQYLGKPHAKAKPKQAK